jgi:hypothetical protein
MQKEAVESFEDLLARVDHLIRAAESGPIDPVVVDYLHTTRERMVRLRERVQEDRRTAPREPERTEARLVSQGEAILVRILDTSETGFGLWSPERVPPDTYARLDIDGDSQEVIYEGLVTHCQPDDEHGYRVGLDVVSSLRIG